MPRVEVDAARARPERARRGPPPRPARRAGRRVLRPGPRSDEPATRRGAGHVGDRGDGARTGGRRGGVLAGAAGGADRRPPRRAAGPGRAADHRPGPPLRSDGEVVRGGAAVRRRPRDDGARALDRRPGRGDGDRRTGGPRPSQRPVPRAAAARRALDRVRRHGRVGPVRDGRGRATAARRRRDRRPRRPNRRHRARARSSRARTTTRASPTRWPRSRTRPASRSSPIRCPACAPASTTGAW